MPKSLGLKQIVNEPTRKDRILDVVLTDLPASFKTLATLGTSDHNPVLVKLDVPLHRDKPYRRKVWHYDKADYWGMRGYPSSVNCSHAIQFDPEEACSNVTNIITDAMDIFIPSKLVTKKTGEKVWFDDHCRKAATKKRRLFRKMKGKNSTDLNKEKFTKARKDYNRAERQAKNRYKNKLKEELTDGSLSSKKWWNTVNSFLWEKRQSRYTCLKGSGPRLHHRSWKSRNTRSYQCR